MVVMNITVVELFLAGVFDVSTRPQVGRRVPGLDRDTTQAQVRITLARTGKNMVLRRRMWSSDVVVQTWQKQVGTVEEDPGCLAGTLSSRMYVLGSISKRHSHG